MASNAERRSGAALHIVTDISAAVNGACIGAGIALNEPLLIILGSGLAIQGGHVVFIYHHFNEKIDKMSHDFDRRMDEMNQRVDELAHKLDEHEHNSTIVFQDGEPVEPNPDTATQDEINTYKTAVLNAGFTPPNESNNNETPHQ
ncbi:MAG TPA: hypothetical protein VMR81_07870 [Patescibacteria group bacterium]|nr:hypothetical protein [Patescibacteria group bacterium]